MSRHRNVRSMNYDEEYEGYDDVYGHSVEDDYCVSPSASQYMYDRSTQHQMSSYFEEDIAEEPEEEAAAQENEIVRKRMDSLTIESAMANLVPEEEMLLKSCLDEIHNVVGDSIADSVIISHILTNKFDVEKALDNCLKEATRDIQKTQKRRERNESDRPVRVVEKETSKGPVPKVVALDATIGGTVRNVVSPQPQPIKASNSSVSVTKGFDLPSANTLTPNMEPRSRSGASSPVPAYSPQPTSTPVTPKISKKEFNAETALKEYSKERGGTKDLLNLLVIGHVDAGKSTLMGHLLFQLGQVPKKAMHKYEQESKKLGKQSFMYAWVLDETGEERSRGITMDVGQSKFETSTKAVVLLDAPGHKDFIPNMITGASQADVSILVVDAITGEFETGFESGGQTREHALLVRSLGVTQIVVAVNKLDTVNWSEERFNEIKSKLCPFLVKQCGFRDSDITFVPCSGLVGDNLTKASNESLLTKWYKGPSLLKAIDSFRPPERPVGKPLRITVNDVFKGAGGLCVGGKVETGMVQAGDKVLIQPVGEIATIKSITLEEELGSVAFAGDPVLITLQTVSDAISIGVILSDPNYPAKVTCRFQARIVTFEAMNVPLTKGFTGVIHVGSLSEQVTVKKLISHLNKGTGEVIKLKPRCLLKNSNGVVELELARPACLEEFKDVKELGRFTLRCAGVTVAAGVVTQVL